MLLEAVLSFLGLGVQAPMSSWGSLIKEGSKMDIAPWLIFFPGLFFSLTLLPLIFSEMDFVMHLIPNLPKTDEISGDQKS